MINPTIEDSVEWSGYDKQGNLCVLTGDVISVNYELETINVQWNANPMKLEFHANVPWSKFNGDDWELVKCPS